MRFDVMMYFFDYMAYVMSVILDTMTYFCYHDVFSVYLYVNDVVFDGIIYFLMS